MPRCIKCSDEGIQQHVDTSFGQHSEWRLYDCHMICPECSGTGSRDISFFTSEGKYYYLLCHRCRGKKIISACIQQDTLPSIWV